MKEDRHEKLKLSNEMLDAMLAGVKTQQDLWGKEGIITQINKTLLEHILNAELDFHLNDTNVGRAAGNIELSTPRDRHSTFQPLNVPLNRPCSKRLSPLSIR